jgi:hypothetical protein
VDISRNNSKSGQPHWDNLHWARNYIAGQGRPLTCVNIYGGEANVPYI